MDLSDVITEIRNERRNVGFDSYDITVKQLVDMISEKQINISPDYQRRFIWDSARQSQLVESIFLGIPIPSLFMATNEDATWEVIDGLQRLTTMVNYVDHSIGVACNTGLQKLRLKSLEKIPSLNGSTFDDLPSNLKLSFLTRPIRITVLNDRSDYQVRFDLFERLNTGGIVLHDQEIRNCVFQGPFNDFIKKSAQDPRLDRLVRRSDKSGRGNIEELVLKFFAYFENREYFKHSVKDFLNEYMERKSNNFTNKSQLESIFNETISILYDSLPNGIVRSARPNSTPLILFEAIIVGVADLLTAGKLVVPEKLRLILDDEDLKNLTTGATNSLPKLRNRIDFVVSRIGA